ncbi:hypothetical protein EON65_10630 [archaeon]|nr:MAG: hypothetical protein EON65_10630 [archaeon]
MDGFVKVLNLEALNELFSIKLDCGILNMQVLKMGPHGHGCILTLSDASIKLWKITSVCDFFATSSSRIRQIYLFENLESELEYFYKLKYATQTYQAVERIDEVDVSEKGDNKALEDGEGGDGKGEGEGEEGGQKKITDSSAAATQTNDAKKVEVTDTGKIDDRIIATFSSQDLRCFTHKGQLMGRLEPEHIVDGIKAYTVSVYQKLLICLCEKDKVRVHDLKRFTFPLLYEFSLHGNKTGSSDAQGDSPEPFQHKKAHKDDMGVCVALVDIAPGNILRSTKSPKQKLSEDRDIADEGDVKRDIRGNIIPEYIESYLLIGLNTGSILFLDTLNNFEVQMNFQANNGVVEDIKYRRRLRQLLVLGKDFSETYSTVRIWQMPEMELVAELSNLRKVSCFAISLSTSYFAVGTTTGTVRIFNVDNEDKTVSEVGKVSESHDQMVTGLCFCDEVRVLCSSSLDCRVKFWDFDKRLVRTILLNLPTCGVIQNGKPGDVIMAQNHYLLTIPKRIWDEGDILDDLRQQVSNTQPDTKTIEQEIGDQKQMQKQSPLVAQPNEYVKIPPALSLPSESRREEDSQHPVVSATPSNRKAAGRRNSRRGSKATTPDSDSQSDSGSLRKVDKRKISFGSLLPDPCNDPAPQSNVAAFTDEMEQQVLLPQLQAAQFQYLKGQKGVVLEESCVESVYSRMQQYSSVDGGKHQACTSRQHRPSDPFIFDTLHPRFLLHKKPPARAMQLEEVENFSSYLTQLNSNKTSESQNTNLLNAGLVRYRESSLSSTQQRSFVAEQPGDSKARRIAQFGLSPRARITLINSKPIETGTQASASFIKSDESGQSTGEMVNAVKGAAASTYLAKAKENIICSLAIAMKVSSNYRNHRKSIIQARHDRFDLLRQRASMLVSEKDNEVLMEKYKDGMIQIREHALEDEEDEIYKDDDKVEQQEEAILSLHSQIPKDTALQSAVLPELVSAHSSAEEPAKEVAYIEAPPNIASRSRKPIRPQLVNRTKSGQFID